MYDGNFQVVRSPVQYLYLNLGYLQKEKITYIFHPQLLVK